MLADKPPPAQWEGFPHALRQSFPIIETLDGRVLYPHFTDAAKSVAPLGSATATFLGLESVSRSVEKREKFTECDGKSGIARIT